MAEAPKLTTPELVAALRRCSDRASCPGCHFYRLNDNSTDCMDDLMRAAARRLEDLNVEEVAD